MGRGEKHAKAVDGLKKLGQMAATRKAPDVTVALPKQKDVAYIWKGASIHPMQTLQNIHHRTVREALRGIEGDDAQRDAASQQLGAFFYFDAAGPKPLPPPDKIDGGDSLEERVASSKQRLDHLVRIVRNLETFVDPRELPAMARDHLGEELKELKAIAGAVPGSPVCMQELGRELELIQKDLDNAAGDRTKLTAVGSNLEDAAAELEKRLLAMCSIANFHVIDTFYLWRLLVKYRYLANEVTPATQSDLSGEVTGLLHNGPNRETAFITEWLTNKLVELNEKLERLDEANLFFYLKGGRALQYMMGTPEKGENDFDTGVIINPNLPVDAWYELFRKVHNLCLQHLRQSKYEFIKLMEDNADAFSEYVDTLAGQPDSDDDDDDDDDESVRFADVLARLEPPDQRAGGKAELIDIGMPRRDTPEVWETWHLKANALVGPDGMVYPGPLYYIGEYAMMIRDAFQPGSRAAKKTPKRLRRLSDLLETDKADAAVANEIEHMPAQLLSRSVAATATFGNTAKVVKCVLKQLADAHLLREDSGFNAEFDRYFATQCGRKADVVRYSNEFKDAIKDLPPAQKDTADACAFVHAIATAAEEHIADRGEFFRRNRREISRFVKAIFNASIFANQAEDLDVMFAITGSFAARLHAEYAGYEHMEDIEPFHRVDLKIFAKPDAKPEIVKDIIGPAILKAHKSDPAAPQYVLESDTGSIKAYWPWQETMGQFTYTPLILRLIVEKRADDWPQLNFVWGYPVLSLRDLVWDYIKDCGETEEFSARQRLRKTASALTDILTKFENPAAQPVAAALAAAATAGAQPGPPPPPQQGPQAQPQPAPLVEHSVNGLAKIAQKKSNWCWAAVSAMMRNFYAQANVTQEQIVLNLSNNEDDHQGPLMLPGLTYRKNGQGVILSWQQLKGELDANRPFIFASGNHYMVATGYEEQGAARTLKFWDPLPTNAGREGSLSYDQYRRTVRADGATYYGFARA